MGRKRTAADPTPRLTATETPELQPQEKMAEDYRIAFSTEAGNAVLRDLESRFQLRGSFVPDSNVTAFHEGQRDVYRLILLMIAKDVARGTKPTVAITEEKTSDG